MATNITQPTQIPVIDFVNSVEDERKKKDSLHLLELMRDVSGHEPVMWGPSIIGFGSYHYKYESGHEGDAPLIGFSPRKAAISLYVFTGLEEHEKFLEDLGKFKRGKACIYVKKMADVDEESLKRLIRETIDFLQTKYGDN